MPRKKSKRYTVEAGDDQFYFSYGKEITETQLKRVTGHLSKAWQDELLPGLKLKDEDGQLLKPELKVVLVPSKE